MKTILSFLTVLSFSIFTLAPLCVAETAPGTRSDAPPRIVVLPFHVVAAEKSQDIRKSIDAFLCGRLSTETCTVFLQPQTPAASGLSEKLIGKPADALAVSDELKGDYLIYGSLVQFGDTLTTDVFLYDRSRQKAVLHFSDMGKGDGALLVQLSDASKKIKAILSPACYAAEAVVVPAISPSGTLEPDTLWKSRAIHDRVNGIAVADLNNDKQPDYILASDTAVTFYTMDKDQLREIASVKVPDGGCAVGVDVADLNKNSKPEVFVSVIAEDKQTLASFILEWDGKTFTTLRKNLKWIFRSTRPAGGKEPVMMVQKNKTLTSTLGSPVYELVCVSGEYAEGKAQPLPEGTTLSSFAFSSKEGERLTALYSFNNRLRVLDNEMNLRWESDELFGGGAVAMAVQDTSDSEQTNHLYLEPRILFQDINGDGVDELLAVRNSEISRHLFSGLKSYTKGQIVVLRPGQLGFSELYATEKASGYISDFSLVDTDSDMQPELVYTMVTKGKSLFSTKLSYVVIQKTAQWSK